MQGLIFRKKNKRDRWILIYAQHEYKMSAHNMSRKGTALRNQLYMPLLQSVMKRGPVPVFLIALLKLLKIRIKVLEIDAKQAFDRCLCLLSRSCSRT